MQDTVTTGKFPLSEAQNLSLFFWTDMEVALPGVVESELNLSKIIYSLSLNTHVPEFYYFKGAINKFIEIVV